MPRPATPQPGDPILATWGQEVGDFAGEYLRFVRIPMKTVVNQNDTAPAATKQALELLDLPSDGSVAFAHLSVLGQAQVQGTNTTLNLYDADGNNGQHWYMNGDNGNYTAGGATPVKVGGLNKRSVMWSRSTVDVTMNVRLHGYWVRETPDAAAH